MESMDKKKVTDRGSGAVTNLKITGPRSMRNEDDQEDQVDGVRDSMIDRDMTGDKVKKEEGRKRRSEGERDSRKKINKGGEDDRRGMEEMGSRMTNFLKENVREKKQQGAGILRLLRHMQ